jgi:hypothetical protein
MVKYCVPFEVRTEFGCKALMLRDSDTSRIRLGSSSPRSKQLVLVMRGKTGNWHDAQTRQEIQLRLQQRQDKGTRNNLTMCVW